MNYKYPVSHDWTTEELIDVVNFFHAVETAYEKGVQKDVLLEAYRRFKEIVPGKADEKNYCNDFEEASGYSPYRTVQKMKSADSNAIIKM